MARVAWVLLAATVLLPLPGLAQEGTAPVAIPLLTDDAGDVQAHAGEVPTTLPSGGSADNMDLRSLAGQETPTDIVLTLGAQAVDPGPAQTLFSPEYRVQFRHLDVTYALYLYVFNSGLAGGPIYQGILEVLEDPAADFGAFVAEIPVTPDLAAKTLTATIARDLLVDGEGAAPYPGRALDQFVATAGFLQGGTITIDGNGAPSPYIQDRMPDTGFGEVVLPILTGIAQTGSLRLSSNEPFRTSNGEASTFVFRLNATNSGPEQLAEFVAIGAPAAWDVRVPGLVRLPANNTVEVPIIVRTAFAHAHGSTTAFTIELIGQDGLGSVGRVQIGLRYPTIPQPAGHHNEAYLHNVDFSDDPATLALALALRAAVGGDNARMPYFNSAPPEEDDQDSGTAVIGQYCELRALDNDTVGSSYCWDAPLNPRLEMGLDFDLGAEGTYSVPIHSLYPQPAARIQGQLLYYPPLPASEQNFPTIFRDDAVVIAELAPSDKVDLVANQDHVFTGIVKATKDGDLIPYAKGASLLLHLELLNGRPDNFYMGPKLEPELSPGAFMRLPLLEYEDPIDEAYGTVTSVHLLLDGDGHREANPGDTVVYTVTMHNAAADRQDFTAALVGSNRGWGRIVGDDRFSTDSDGSRTLTVAVTVPDDALDEDRADLVLEVASQDDIGARALVRLVTTVDTDADHDDDSALLGQAGAAKDTPWGSPATLSLALVALALARRKGARWD